MLHELRIYHCAPGRLPALNKRFETVTLKLWEKHGSREGHEAQFWQQAERELKGEASSSDTSRGVTANAPSARSGSGSDGPGKV